MMPSSLPGDEILERLDHLVGLVVGVQNDQVHAELLRAVFRKLM